MAKIAIYVQTKYAKSAYKKDSYEKRVFPGIEMVKNELTISNLSVEFCSCCNVNKFNVILVSITSQCDWISFIAERVLWPKGDYVVVVGGFGVINTRPLLQYADYFYLGRAEFDIAKMCTELINKEYVDRPWVIEAKKFSMDKTYKIRQVDAPYPYKYNEESSTICEQVVGCQRKCLFCSFTWHRKYVGAGLQKDSGIFAGNAEKTMFEILGGDHKNLDSLRMVGLDGISERVRRVVNKPISNNDLVELSKILSLKSKPHHIKLYNIVGYPFEVDSDYEEFAETIIKCDEAMVNGKFCYEIHSTPFRPMPVTPMACMATKYNNYRKNISKSLRKYTGKAGSNSVFYNGKNLFALETMGTESLSTVIEDMIIIRGIESDAENLKKLALSKKYKSLATSQKITTLEKYFDVNTLFGEYKPKDLPTKNIETYCKIDYDFFNNLIEKKLDPDIIIKKNGVEI